MYADTIADAYEAPSLLSASAPASTRRTASDSMDVDMVDSPAARLPTGPRRGGAGAGGGFVGGRGAARSGNSFAGRGIQHQAPIQQQQQAAPVSLLDRVNGGGNKAQQISTAPKSLAERLGQSTTQGKGKGVAKTNGSTGGSLLDRLK
jgi:hypothetical protein